MQNRVRIIDWLLFELYFYTEYDIEKLRKYIDYNKCVDRIIKRRVTSKVDKSPRSCSSQCKLLK
jgi:hypothetical protein